MTERYKNSIILGIIGNDRYGISKEYEEGRQINCK